MSENSNSQPITETTLREKAILEFWESKNIFQKSVDKHAPKGDYVFYDGPPFATGLPHYGHMITGIIKDVVPRYKTMRGYRVPRVWGWDCHGLPIENIVEKELGFKHKKDIKDYGIAKFNERCREQVMTYAAEWEKMIPRTGRWVDMQNAYRTMDKPYMESVWWVFKTIYDKGLVYEDYRSMHICTRCETTLSQQEVSEGYKDVKDISVTVKFRLKNPEKMGWSGNVYMLAWTTTPWTLPGNVALAVGNGIDYVLVHAKGESFIMAQSRAAALFPGVLFSGKQVSSVEGIPSVSDPFKGETLVGLEYEPPFDYYIKDTKLKNHENGWKIYAADFVTADSGTGIAHEAPAFGADDWELSKKVNLPFVQHVNFDGTMKPEVTAFAGMEVKPRSDDDKVRLGTDIAVLKYLQDNGLFFSKENIVHSYPHCWRCDTPLLNYATSSWFVSVTKIKDDLKAAAQTINWQPEHIKEGLFGNWLDGAKDWGISRQRFWASVIPLWVCNGTASSGAPPAGGQVQASSGCGHRRVFGSAAELEQVSGKTIEDLHKHIVDEITFPCDTCKGVMRRIPDVLDTWFDSGSMPYGQVHYPFEHKEVFEKTFPAQFITEYTGQFRAWFYYLHVLAGATFNTNAFQNVVAHGIVLAEDGKKMSKRLQNYPDPMEIIHKYGADALRLYMISSPLLQAENLNFSEKGVEDIAKKNIGRLNNVLAFYKLYANDTVRDWKSENVLDRWILARLDQMIREVTDGFEKYQLDVASRPIAGFIDDLSVWYLRRSRDRFKEDGPDKTAALTTIRYVLHALSRVMAPTMPFFAEYLFQEIREGEDEESVHLSAWPEPTATANFIQRLLGRDGGQEQLLVAMQTAREIVTAALEVREKAGLKIRQPLAMLSVPAGTDLGAEFLAIIAEEINVKSVQVHGTTITLDTVLTDELREEGFIRELTRAIQSARKEAGLNPHDMIRLRLGAEGDARAAIERNIVEMKSSVGAAEISVVEPGEHAKEIGGSRISISLQATS